MSECTLVRLIVYTLMIPFVPATVNFKKARAHRHFRAGRRCTGAILVGEISIIAAFLGYNFIPIRGLLSRSFMRLSAVGRYEFLRRPQQSWTTLR
jgi:hypothetical protein